MRNMLLGAAGIVLLGSGTALGMTIIVNEATVSGDFSTIFTQGDISGFTDSGDISHFTAILALQNSANSEEAIAFAPITGFPSAGQSTPDHPVVPFPAGSAGRTIDITSAVVDLVNNTYSIAGILQGDWTVTLPSDYNIIIGFQNSANQEEGIAFSGITISEPAPVALFGLALIVFASAGLRARRHADLANR